MRLLVADDSRDIAEVVAFGARMTWPGCRVDIAAGGEEALQTFKENPPDLVVLDVEMPEPNGFDVCRLIREQSSVPILMLTAHDNAMDKVRALDLGADDYLTKPFNHLELLARMRAVVRRTVRPEQQQQRLEVGDFAIDFVTREVQMRGQPVALTSTEYRLLEMLARHAGTVLTHQELLVRIWGPQYAGETHYLKIFARRLRRKLGDDAERPQYIQTEWGTGYRFRAPD